MHTIVPQVPGKNRPSVGCASLRQLPRLFPIEHLPPSGTAPASALLSRRRDRRMRPTWAIVAGALVFASGCRSSDWIDRTLVTVDVTGAWSGSVVGGSPFGDLLLELNQQGSTVKGSLQVGLKSSYTG